MESETWNKENMSSLVGISVFEAFSNRSSVAFCVVFFLFVLLVLSLRQRPGREGLNSAVFAVSLTKLTLQSVCLK